ncbi:MAG TPA: DnaJ domain-containing protein, partial [Polyangiaceae bacterium]|nr:DnaJ domain-containing protein [Polyangiaceae bacterium]
MVRGESTVGESIRDGALTLVSGVSMRDLPIGPTEAFVLSRVEGSITKAELVIATGLDAEQIESIVARLILLGALEFAQRHSMVSSIQSPPERSGARSGSHSIPLAARSEGTGEWTPEQQQQLLELDRRHSNIDHYQLLGVEPSADAKTIRAAYYELVRVYHPDRFFGKQLGEYEGPLTRVFGRFSEAYEVLHRSESRAEYDRYLGARQRTVDFDRYFQESPGGPRAPASSPPASNAPASNAPASSPPAGTSASNPPASGPSSGESLRRASSSVPPSDSDARRRALARKLGHSSMPPSASQQMAAVNEAARAAEELKQRY